MIFVWLCGCSLISGTTPPEEPGNQAEESQELGKSKVDTPEPELLKKAKNAFGGAVYTTAKESFEALRTGYPMGPYADFAELKLADAAFETAEYDSAAMYYEEFTRSHPASSATPYALFRAARSFQLGGHSVGRDPTAMKKSADLYDALISRHPASPYVSSAKEFRDQARRILLAHDKALIDYYRQRNKPEALNARAKEFKDRWGKEASAEQPDEPAPAYVDPARLAEQEQRLARSLLASEYTPEPVPGPPVRNGLPAPAAQSLKRPDDGSMLISIKNLECDRDQRLITLYLEEPAEIEEKPLSFFNDSSGSRTRLAKVSVNLPETKDFDCFETNDLGISPGGELHLRESFKEAEVMRLDNPPRLLLAVK